VTRVRRYIGNTLAEGDSIGYGNIPLGVDPGARAGRHSLEETRNSLIMAEEEKKYNDLRRSI